MPVACYMLLYYFLVVKLVMVWRIIMWKLILVFLFFILMDISMHLILKLKRRLAGYILLLGTGICIIVTIVMKPGNNDGYKDAVKDDVYIAYKYLTEGNPVQASIVLEEAGNENNPEIQFLSSVANIMQGDYIHGYFLLERAADNNKTSSNGKKCIEELMDLCNQELDGKQAGSYNELLANIEKENAGYNTESITNSEKFQFINDTLDKFIDAMDYSSEEKKEYQNDYEVDYMFTTGGSPEISGIDDLEGKYGNTQKVLQYKCKYYVQAGNYALAKETAKELTDKYNVVDNHIIYTDIIAQEIYESDVLKKDIFGRYGNSGNDGYDDSASIDNLPVKQDYKASLTTTWDDILEESGDIGNDNVYGDDDGYDDEMGSSYKYKDIDIYTVDGAREVLKRAINYINAKKGNKEDNTGMYDLQLAKLNLVAGNEEEAGICLENLIKNSVNINENSKIKKEVEEVVTLYNQIKGTEMDTRLENAVRRLINAQSSGIIPNEEDTINDTFNKYVANTLRYDKISVFISRIDTSHYPEITAYININGTKDDKTGLASDFVKNDFNVEDTLYGIDDFEFVNDEEMGNINIGIVMDKSGSMRGTPIEDAKKAAAAAVSNMDGETQKISIISYDDDVVVEHSLDNDKESIYSSIYNINSGGGTNISSGLMEGIEAIRREQGTRAIILMSDGRDGGSVESMEQVLKVAKDENIAVFTVAFGDCDTEYMKNIADSTGGIFIPALESEDLSYIYLTLQRYIVNNYRIKYTVKENIDTDPRYLCIKIDEYATGVVKDYWLKEENRPDAGEEHDNTEIITDVDKAEKDSLEITSVSPGNVSIEALEQGIQISVYGKGFKDGISVSVGGYPLKDIKVENGKFLTGMIKGTFSEGTYGILAKIGKKEAAFTGITVFRGGMSTEIKLGGCTITADSIKQITAGSYMASGNVLLNGFVHCGGYVNITSEDTAGIVRTALSGDSINIGTHGTISGAGKLYVNYAKGTKADDNFTNIAIEGKDYIIQHLAWTGNVTPDGTEFDNSKYTLLGIEIPNILSIDVADISLKDKTLTIDITSAKMDKLLSGITDTLKEGKDKKDSSKDKSGGKTEDVELAKTKYNSFDFGGFDWNVKLTCREDGLYFGGSIKANVNDSIQFDMFGINNVSFELDSLDKDKKYWELAGSFDFSKRWNIKGGSANGFGGSLSSYYWLPDTIKLNVDMDPGIPVYEVIEIKQLKGSLHGMSTIALKLYEGVSRLVKQNVEIREKETGFEEVILSAGLKADANIFNIADIGQVPLLKNIKEYGELGTLTADAALQFYNPFELSANADVKILKQNTKANVAIGQNGFSADGSVNISSIQLLCFELSGNAKTSIWAKTENIGIQAELNGNIKTVFPGWIEKSNGKSSDIKLEYLCQKKILSIEVIQNSNGKKKTRRVWYDANADISLLNRLHFEEY